MGWGGFLALMKKGVVLLFRKAPVSWRGRGKLVAAFVFVLGALIAVPTVSNAKPTPSSVKLFTARISPPTATGNAAGSWTETVHNCGLSDSETPCNVSSTIGLAVVQIGVPAAFQASDFSVTSPTTSTGNHKWDVSYNSSTHIITAQADTGSDKLAAGESVAITFSATLSSCAVTGDQPFPTQAWGDFNHSDQFTVAGTNGSTTANPVVTINSCTLDPGESATGPNGTTVTNGSDETVSLSFGANFACPSDPQWAAGYHMPDAVTITPEGTTTNVKPFTFTFNPISGVDSSWYVVCYSSDTSATTGTILPRCYTADGTLHDPPCVSDQRRTLPPYSSSNPDKISITIRVPAGDPLTH
jgi:hypothetical protein